MDRKKFRKRMVPAAVIAVLAAVPAAAYADEPKDNVFVAEPGNPYDEATWNRIHDNVLEYDEIGILVNEFSPTYKNLRETYEDNKNASNDVEKVKEQLMAGSGALIDQANSLSDTASSIRDMLGYQNMVTPDAYASMVYSAELLNYQSEQMLLMGDSVTEVTPEMLHVQVVETGRASLISGAQTAMIGYEQLLLSKEQLESSLELLEAVYQSTVTQANVGMATQADVLSAKQNLESAQAGMLTIEANEQNIRQTLCTMLGWAYNASPEIRPVPAADESRIAVMNPELTYTLPKYQTACGCTDILMHTMERYFTQEEHTELTDRLAEGLMKTVMDSARVLMDEPENYNARAQVMWAGSLSHNGLTGCGTDGGDWATHQLEHEIGALFDVAHGAGLAAIWGSWARYVMDADLPRFARFAVNVMGVEQDFRSQEATAEAGICALEDFFRSLDMPVSIHELIGRQITDAEIEEMADKCSRGGTFEIGGMKRLGRGDMVNIYRMAR